jgi:transposase
MDRASLEGFLARGLSLEAIGRRTGRHESTVAYWVVKYGLQAANHDRHVARGGLDRETLRGLVEQGASIAEMADRLNRSKGTIRHWLARFGLRTSNRAGRRPSEGEVAAKEAGLALMRMTCTRHGETDFCLDTRGGYRCKRCRSAAVTRRRRKVKTILVEEAGGACCICGYAGNMRALHFHHVDPSQKRMEINAKGVSLSLDRVRAEAQKCVLLCSNCHAEGEDGTASIPADTLAGAGADPGSHDPG